MHQPGGAHLGGGLGQAGSCEGCLEGALQLKEGLHNLHLIKAAQVGTLPARRRRRRPLGRLPLPGRRALPLKPRAEVGRFQEPPVERYQRRLRPKHTNPAQHMGSTKVSEGMIPYVDSQQRLSKAEMQSEEIQSRLGVATLMCLKAGKRKGRQEHQVTKSCPHLVCKAFKEDWWEAGAREAVQEVGVAEGREVGRALHGHRPRAGRGRRGLPEGRKGRQKRARELAKVLPQRRRVGR